MIGFTEDMRITGWNSPSKEDLLKLKPVAENQFDTYGRPNWIWSDYPEGEPIYSPQPYSPEQQEEMRTEYVRAEIEKLYPQDLQMKILTEERLGEVDAFNEMQAHRQRIKDESKLKDFKILGELL